MDDGYERNGEMKRSERVWQSNGGANRLRLSELRDDETNGFAGFYSFSLAD